MKVIIITGNLEFCDGVTTYIQHLINILSKKNKILLVAASNDASSSFRIPNVEIKIIKELDFNKRSVINFSKAIIKLIFIIKKFSPDIIHSNNHYTANIAKFAQKFSFHKTKLIQTVHGDFVNVGKLKKYTADKFIFVNQHILDTAVIEEPKIRKHSFLIFNGIKFHAGTILKTVYDNEEIIITVASRLEESKGIQNVIRSLMLLPDIYKKKIKLLIAGVGLYENCLRDLFNGVSINYSFLGLVTEMDVLYKKTDIFVFSGVTDSFGYTWLEAVNFGCFLIISRFGGIEYLLEEDGNFLSYNKTSYEELSEKIKIALDLGYKKRRSKAFKLKQILSEKFTAEQMAMQTYRVYLA